MQNFVQLEIAEYERLKEFEKLVERNTVFTRYQYSTGRPYFAEFNCPEELKNVVRELETLKREKDAELQDRNYTIGKLYTKIHRMHERTLWQRIINKDVE